ncbi:helix-turn-helix domain-containing protein [Thalassoroseus pseudoceratinae]|uniref:helix-turn-helix domain-containing protein n=1 Tax=Thalassoroseus pseudoceratinae TaxID=2713176 RepID=UPI001423CCC9|nr:helix-turn-helix domain-containing protein [Thalassoroseus pseudoceratinae]
MSTERLTSAQAASRLGISVATLYGWLRESNVGEFFVRGQKYTIEYFQGGRNGQGRIRIDAAEVERLQNAMRVHPRSTPEKPPRRMQPLQYPGITVPLGRPDDHLR